MPRHKPAEAQVIPTNSLVASAVRYPGKSATTFYRPKQEWQAECYRHYAICGEARFAAKFFGHAVSRAVLKAADIIDGVTVEQTEGEAHDVLTALFNGKDGQKQMLDACGVHLTIGGEVFLVGRTVANDDGEEAEIWEIISPLEMDTNGGRWLIRQSGAKPIELTADDAVIRIWLPHPADRLQADSPFRALLPVLSEIEWLTRHVYAQVTSRLAGAGILMLPQGMTFPPPPDVDGKAVETSNEADSFMLTLADGMMTAIEDPGLPSARVPIVVTAPDDTIDKARLLTFWSELDSAALSLRQEAIRRFALGMDLPPEQVLGMSSNSGTGGGTSNGVSHWGAWQIEEATIKMHVEPMLDAIVNALTISYLRPNLPTTSLALIIYDTSALRLRPDRSKEAFELYDRGLISATALLRENRFGEEDRPSDEEFKRWMLVKIASGSATPEQVQAALGALGIGLVVPELTGEAREARPAPSLEEHPTNPRTPDEAALLYACDALVYRALERAGNRLRQKGVKPPGVPSYETHTALPVADSTAALALLDDAWPTAENVLDGIGGSERVVPILNSYCVALLVEGSVHKRERLEGWLRLGRTA